MSTGRLPHTSSLSDSQHRRRFNELSDQVQNTVGSIEGNNGDIGTLQNEITTIQNELALPPLNGQFVTATSSGTPNTEFSVSHTLGRVPVAAFVAWQSLAASLYQGPTTGTAWTNTTIFLKCSVASVQFSVYIS